MRSLFFCLVVILLGATSVAEAQPSLVSGLGGTAGYGTSMVARGDAENVEVVLGTAFPSGISLLGAAYTSVWVNTDGNVSFGGSQAYRPDAFPGSPRPIIAAWWADVDTTPGPQAGDPAGANTVYWDLRAGQLTVTWFLVGYYDARTDQRVSVQLLMRQAVGEPAGVVTVEIRYNRCDWFQGMRVDSIPAQAGFDLGDRTRYLALPYSGEFTVVDHVCSGTSNTGVSGYWVFQSDALPTPMCGNFMRETGEQCDDGMVPGPPCEADCSRTPAMMMDATWLPEGGRPDAAFPFVDAQLGRDGGGGDMDGGGGDIDGGGGGDRDGGGGPGGDGIDVFGGGCSIGPGASAHGRGGASPILLALAALALRRARSRAGR